MAVFNIHKILEGEQDANLLHLVQHILVGGELAIETKELQFLLGQIL